MNPSASHLASSPTLGSGSALIDAVSSLTSIPKSPWIASAPSLVSQAVLPITATPAPTPNISPTTTVSTTRPNSTQLKRSKGLYITKNGTSKRLNYFYEDQEKESVLHMIDDDKDGDKDIFYTLGNAIYRKENHTQSPKKIYIKDRPQIFTLTSMMSEFFGQSTTDIAALPHDMQIFLRYGNTPGNLQGQYIIDKKTSHKQFDIFSTWGESDPEQAQYRIDSMMISEAPSKGYILLPQPVLSDVSGQVVLHRKKIYRTLLPGGKYTEGTTALQNLPADFVIRAKKIAYTKEKTTFQLIV